MSKLTRKRIQLEKDCDVVTERAKTSPYTLLVSRVAQVGRGRWLVARCVAPRHRHCCAHVQPGIVAGLLLWYWSSPGLCIPRYWAWPLGRGDSYSDCSRIGIVVWLAVSHLLATSVAAFVFSPWLLWRCRHMLP